MSTIIIGDQIRIPGWVVDLQSFRLWARSKEFPQHGWFSHIRGELWADASMVQRTNELGYVEYILEVR
jgi:hypothetical protein